MCCDCCDDGDGDAGVDGTRGDGGVVDVLEAQTYWDDDAANDWSQRWIHITLAALS